MFIYQCFQLRSKENKCFSRLSRETMQHTFLDPRVSVSKQQSPSQLDHRLMSDELSVASSNNLASGQNKD